MDDIVKQAMAKWPQVPACFDWLGFDDRGDWYMRDDAVQALGGFTVAKGSKLNHTKLIEFIERNYQCDAQGRFKTGPNAFMWNCSQPLLFGGFKTTAN